MHKPEGNLAVVRVNERTDNNVVSVYPLDYDFFWVGPFHHRIVVPQLIPSVDQSL